VSGRARAAVLALALLAGLAVRSPDASADDATIAHKVRAGDTFELLAAEYYGDRHHYIFLLVANGLDHARPLKPGERLKIPVSREITAAAGDTVASLAAAYLGDERRAGFLAEYNGLDASESIAAGHTLAVPVTITRRAVAREPLADIASAYFADVAQAALIKEYNFLDHDTLEPGETVVIPIFHVRVRAGKLPAPDAESKARTERRREIQEQAQAVLPGARAAWKSGEYSAVKRELTPIAADSDYLDIDLAVDVGVLLGSAYVAFGDDDSALATFKRVLARKPKHVIGAYQHSPKVREVWKRAGGAVAAER
jgi:LysM repeat protein